TEIYTLSLPDALPISQTQSQTHLHTNTDITTFEACPLFLSPCREALAAPLFLDGVHLLCSLHRSCDLATALHQLRHTHTHTHTHTHRHTHADREKERERKRVQ